jgi:hypothetical protein
MLKRAAYFALFLVALMAAALVLERTSSPFFQKCINENEDSNNQSAAKENPAAFGIVAIYVRCSGRFIDRHDAAITALATIIIAAFTFTLWQSSEKMWKVTRVSAFAAERAADASIRQAIIAEETLTKIQRPYVFIYDVIGILPGVTEHMDGHVPYTVANLGQTPAIIEAIEARISKGDVPDEPGPETEDHPLVIAPFLAPQEKRENLRVQSTFWIRGILLLPDIHDPKAHTYVSANIERDENLFVRLRIRYRSVTTDGYETSGCWRYDQAYGLFVRYGGDEYNYAT